MIYGESWSVFFDANWSDDQVYNNCDYTQAPARVEMKAIVYHMLFWVYQEY